MDRFGRPTRHLATLFWNCQPSPNKAGEESGSVLLQILFSVAGVKMHRGLPGEGEGLPARFALTLALVV